MAFIMPLNAMKSLLNEIKFIIVLSKTWKIFYFFFCILLWRRRYYINDRARPTGRINWMEKWRKSDSFVEMSRTWERERDRQAQIKLIPFIIPIIMIIIITLHYSWHSHFIPDRVYSKKFLLSPRFSLLFHFIIPLCLI